ncbi:MAG: hypothetical protein HY748_04655 [Elusimicrobia bacterium]|nr:hypothetical protein [Elusimicrobiota bacterium]
MSNRTNLQTVRLNSGEKALIENYLAGNTIFDGFSSLARVAIMSFIGAEGSVRLKPVGTAGAARPRFLWDYDMSDAQAREILGRPGLSEAKRWLIARILSQARFEEVFSYLDLEDVKRALPKLRLPPKTAERWAYAVERWTRHG